MTKEELSLAISMLSLLVSSIGVFFARRAYGKANTLNAERNELALRQARSTEHAPFAQTLVTVNQRLKDLLSEFQYKADKAYNNIVNMLDEYDTQRKHRSRYLRHIYGTFCNLIYAALSSQLVWQTNIHYRLPALWLDIVHDKEDKKRLVNTLNGIMYNNSLRYRRRSFKQLYSGHRVKAEMLARGIYEIYERIDEKKEMLIEAHNYCQEYFEMFDKLIPTIETSIKELRDLLDMDKYKDFKLCESYVLYDEYMKTITKLEFLSHCGLYRIKETCNSLQNDPLSNSW